MICVVRATSLEKNGFPKLRTKHTVKKKTVKPLKYLWECEIARTFCVTVATKLHTIDTCLYRKNKNL